MPKPRGKKKLRNTGARRGDYTCVKGHKLEKINSRCHPHMCEYLRLHGEQYYTESTKNGCENQVPVRARNNPHRCETYSCMDNEEGLCVIQRKYCEKRIRREYKKKDKSNGG